MNTSNPQFVIGCDILLFIGFVVFAFVVNSAAWRVFWFFALWAIAIVVGCGAVVVALILILKSAF